MPKIYKNRFENRAEELDDDEELAISELQESYEDEFFSYLPKRDDQIYKDIEEFEQYELTRCIAHEMAIRNKDARKIIFSLNRITALRDRLSSQQKYHYLLKHIYSKPYALDNYMVSESLVNKLRIDFLLYPHSYNIKGLEYISPDSYYSYNRHSTDQKSEVSLKYLMSSSYRASETEEFGFTVSQVVNKENKSYQTNIIRPDFKRKIFDTNQMNVLLNLSLSKEEIIAYVEHIIDTINTDLTNIGSFPYKNYLSRNIELIHEKQKEAPKVKKIFKNMTFVPIVKLAELNRDKIKSPLMRQQLGKVLKTPMELLIGELEDAEYTNDFPKKPTGERMANLFFVYDYITARLHHIDNQNIEEKEELQEKIRFIKNDSNIKYKNKLIQIKDVQREYFENLTDTHVVEIIKEENLTKDLNIKSNMASKYYYAIKPYIEKCKYKELLVGVKIT